MIKQSVLSMRRVFSKTSFLILSSVLLLPLVVAAIRRPASHPPVKTAGNSYYVSPNGRGSSCTNRAPCSPNTGLGRMAAGDTLVLKGGDYTGPGGKLMYIGHESGETPSDNATPNQIPGGTSWDNMTKVHVAPGETARLGGIWIRPEASGSSGYIDLDGTGGTLILDGQDEMDLTSIGVRIGGGFNRVRNLEIKEHGSYGIDGCPGGFCEYINLHVHHIAIHRCRVVRSQNPTGLCHGHGIYTIANDILVDGGEYDHLTRAGATHPNPGDRWTIRNIRAHDNWYGILTYGSGYLVSNNVLYNNTHHGILNYGGENTYVNNTISGNGQSGMYLRGCNTVRNNILVQRNPIEWESGTCGTVDHNLTTTADPGFVNAAGGDFHLTSGSPARDAGTTLREVPCDFDGNGRPAGSASDIGAYEYGGRPASNCPKGGGGGGGTPPSRHRRRSTCLVCQGGLVYYAPGTS